MKVYLKKKKNENINDDIDISFLNNIDTNDNKKDDEDNQYHNDDIDILNSLIGFGYSSEDKKRKGKKKKKKKDKSKRKRRKIKTELDDLLKSDDSNIENSKLNKRDGVDFYEQRYKAPLLLLKNILKDINISHKEQKEIIEDMKMKMRNNGKFQPMALSSMFSNVSGLLNTRLGVIKEISAVYNKISDLELKRENQNFKNKEGSKSGEDLTNELMDKALNELLFNNDNNKYDINGDFTADTELTSEGAEVMVNDMLNTGEIELTETERAFKYEKDNVQIQIEYDLESNKWEFIAVDADGNEIADYPLPDKKTIGRIDIDFDNMKGKDKLNNTYNVIYKNDYDF